MRILVVEEEKALANIIRKGLEEEGFAARATSGSLFSMKEILAGRALGVNTVDCVFSLPNP